MISEIDRPAETGVIGLSLSQQKTREHITKQEHDSTAPCVNLTAAHSQSVQYRIAWPVWRSGGGLSELSQILRHAVRPQPALHSRQVRCPDMCELVWGEPGTRS